MIVDNPLDKMVPFVRCSWDRVLSIQLRPCIDRTDNISVLQQTLTNLLSK